MGIIVEEMGRYDPYTDKFIKNTTTDRIEIGTDGNLYKLTVSNGNKFLPIDELYTKTDLVAMLTDIQLEVEEFIGTISPNYDEAAQDISKVIQQKINALKENKGNE